jgi:four helix bundle protein
MRIESHEDLIVWQFAMRLATQVSQLASRLPASEKYEMSSQLRRAGASIPANIAEGWARPTRVYINHLGMALGSEAELKTQLKLVVRMKYLTEAEVAPMLSLASEVGRMLRGLIKSLKQHLELRGLP